MHGMLIDLRSGLRILARSPGSAMLATLILALGIGLTTAMFSIVHGIVLRGLPLERAEELMHLEASQAGRPRNRQRVTLHQFLDWRAGQTAFRELHAFRYDTVYVSGQGLPVRLDGARITPGAFAHLGIRPIHGRALLATDAEIGAEKVAVLGYGAWQRLFGGDPEVVGRAYRIDGRPTVIAGILPEGCRFPERQEIWLPQLLDAGDTPRAEAAAELHVFGRLREGAGLDGARSDMATVNARLAEQYPESDAGLRALIVPYGRYFLSHDDVNLAWTSLGAVGFVLLIACFNVANLLLARASGRSRELAMRSVLGAGRWRMACQAFGEALALALGGAVAGTALAGFLVHRFNQAVAHEEWPFWYDVRLDTASLAAVVACTLAVSVLAGSIPAWRSSQLDVAAALRDSIGVRRGRLSTALVVAEVALSCMLLVGAGLMVRTLVNLTHLDFEFDIDRIFSGRISLLREAYPEPDQLRAVRQAIEQRLRAVPEVEAVALTDRAPAAEWAPMRRYGVDQQVYESAEQQPAARRILVSSGFFATLGVAAVAGRTFTESDMSGGLGVAVVNRSFARRHWPGETAVGKSVRFGSAGRVEAAWRTVIGVVPDLNAGGPSDQRPEAVYLPLETTIRSLAILARVRGEVGEATLLIRDAVAEIAPDLPVYFSGGLRQKTSDELFFYHIVGALFGLMAGVALLLAATGLYGLLSYTVSERTSEMGVRMAYGASAREILLLIVGSGLRQVSVGLSIGLVFAVFVTQLLSSQLYGVSPLDPVTYLSVGVTLLMSAVVAASIPAWQASRVDPVTALRGE